jgi:predicted RNase H-like nuclease
MRSVLGIDAAWTHKNPSGLALAEETPLGWRLVAACSSYEQFLRRDLGTFSSQTPRAVEILDECRNRLGREIDLVAVDMPLSYVPITKRRVSDNEVSIRYGARKCSTHSPNACRPGPISVDFVQGFLKSGYPLRTGPPVQRGIIEVYPHPALVELTNEPERLKYKCGRTSSYWPGKTPLERWSLLRTQWDRIIRCLDGLFGGSVSEHLPEMNDEMTARQKKAFEDAVDAVVCAWVGICALAGMAVAYGDDDSAIWIPVGCIQS